MLPVRCARNRSGASLQIWDRPGLRTGAIAAVRLHLGSCYGARTGNVDAEIALPADKRVAGRRDLSQGELLALIGGGAPGYGADGSAASAA